MTRSGGRDQVRLHTSVQGERSKLMTGTSSKWCPFKKPSGGHLQKLTVA